MSDPDTPSVTPVDTRSVIGSRDVPLWGPGGFVGRCFLADDDYNGRDRLEAGLAAVAALCSDEWLAALAAAEWRA